MNSLILILTKIGIFLSKLFGRGSSFPGSFALKLNKNIIKFFELPETTIFVTGTTGKTTVTNNIYKIYKDAGKRVGCNKKGSNLLEGVLTTLIESSKINGKTAVDALIIEIDERYVKEVFKHITPKYFLVNNLSRDQLARNGHHELVFNEINKSIKESTHLILNADDSLVYKLSLNKKNKISYFGVSKNIYSDKNNNYVRDLTYCPVCHKKLIYEYYNYGNLGLYNCPNNDYNYPELDFNAKVLKKGAISINDNLMNVKTETLYNTYNILAAYSAASVSGIEKEIIVKSLNSLKEKRIDKYTIKGKKLTLLLSKNETPLSYNQSLSYIKNIRTEKTVVIGFTRISGRYNLKDISWIYDINFELLNDKSIKKIILIGPFAYDLAVRLKVEGVDTKKIIYSFEYEDSLDFIIKKSTKNIYAVIYFDLYYKYLKELKGRR